ncbi:N-acetylneuraminate synthase [Tepidibacter formicigenes]|jgi:N-acetylneuraminate synthase/N,N'-diacetyllegionaminate synthase|uniref:N-acetylneuraminate synthase n=1 Tax=Tepidibacter formicigenes DSM 15518 TaxID=1123349 RepID=A0A1M6P089_9FIRM|nr:N-acetylneuraminate synthase [Tepidibacter formicigenes]SHK01328.1 N-acetylneuraminate synthase [Tepidibacter formicigenes DSM 15518]
MSVFIIAEAGVNHNGKIELAYDLIDKAVEAGADAVKFQTFKTEKIIGKKADKAQYQKENTEQTESQFEMVKKLELSYDDFTKLKKYCESKNIMFLSTPDDIDSLNFLCDLGVNYIKVGSTEVTNIDYLKEIAKKQIPIILSTGMSTLGEVEKALDAIYSEGNRDVTLLHATTDYPTNYEDVNLNAMVTLKNAFKVNIGYSDHTLGYEAAIAAVTLGAVIIEKHFTLDKKMEGPDHKASLNPSELKEFVKSIRNTEALLGKGIKKPTNRELKIMDQVRRSIVASKELKKGTILTKDMFEFKRPGNGIKPEFIDILVGRTLKRDLTEDEPIKWEDI